MYGKFVIARSRNQGVVCGYLVSVSGASCTLEDARQIHYWSGEAPNGQQVRTCFELAEWGAGNARISVAVTEILMTEICGVILCTDTSEANLRQSRWNAFFDRSISCPPRKKRSV